MVERCGCGPGAVANSQWGSSPRHGTTGAAAGGMSASAVQCLITPLPPNTRCVMVFFFRTCSPFQLRHHGPSSCAAKHHRSCLCQSQKRRQNCDTVAAPLCSSDLIVGAFAPLSLPPPTRATARRPIVVIAMAKPPAASRGESASPKQASKVPAANQGTVSSCLASLLSRLSPSLFVCPLSPTFLLLSRCPGRHQVRCAETRVNGDQCRRRQAPRAPPETRPTTERYTRLFL